MLQLAGEQSGQGIKIQTSCLLLGNKVDGIPYIYGIHAAIIAVPTNFGSRIRCRSGTPPVQWPGRNACRDSWRREWVPAAGPRWLADGSTVGSPVPSSGGT